MLQGLGVRLPAREVRGAAGEGLEAARRPGRARLYRIRTGQAQPERPLGWHGQFDWRSSAGYRTHDHAHAEEWRE